ncbi:MAG: Isochorismate synthase EntC [bacterium ADurb.BinA186]|nr:MAG: Isochorismate synthase EntC [bacterium ADurb.BinA186]
MLSSRLSDAHTVRDAAKVLLSWLKNAPLNGSHNLSLKINVEHPSEQEFFSPEGCQRIYFKSRDCDLEWWGLGAAESLFQSSVHDQSVLSQVVKKSHFLDDDQIYFGGIKFDKDRVVDDEWKDFQYEIFILPLLLMHHSAEGFTLSLNYRSDGLPYVVWRDHAESILSSIINRKGVVEHKKYTYSDYQCPGETNYYSTIKRALLLLGSHSDYKKVVIGRRTTRSLSMPFDPVQLFFRLKRAPHAFLFMFDSGQGSTFFGASPELLYRRIGQNFETESLAGTRARSLNRDIDEQLRQELLESSKDKSEHFFVSNHIEDRLREFGISDLFTSKIEIMALPFVQHLHRRYHGRIEHGLSDDKIMTALHPTPAVCGINSLWAKQFIREHEGFDRGFFAAPIGYIGKNSAEFAVAIRSALYRASELHIYAAGGIVPGSIPEQEWEELNNKQKNILSIFDE